MDIGVSKGDGFSPTIQSHSAFAKCIDVNSHEHLEASGIIHIHTANYLLLLQMKAYDDFVLFVQGQLPF